MEKDLLKLKRPNVEALTAAIALGLSILFEYLIVASYLYGEKWRHVLTFNGVGEGYLEMLVVFPCCILISGLGLIQAKRNL